MTDESQASPRHIKKALTEAMALQMEGRLDDAEGAFQRILAAHPEHPAALHLAGMLAYQRNRPRVAADLLSRAAAADAGNPDLHNNLATVLIFQGRTAEAEASLRRALDLDPDNGVFLYRLAEALRAQGKTGEAEACFRRTLELIPDMELAYDGLGIVLEAQGRNREAEACYRRLLETRTDAPKALFNLGNALKAQHRPDEAIEAYARAIRIQPDFAQAHVHMAFALLLKGDFEAGWKEYGWRWKVENFPTPPRPFPQDAWNGAPLSGQTVLVHAEQGFGDTIQFARYTGFVAGQGGRIVLEAQPELKRLMRTAPGVAETLARGEPLPDFDFHVPLLDLPGICNTTVDNVPAEVPYLHPDPRLSGEWEQRLGGGGLKVGIAWRSSPGQLSSPQKSCPLDALSPLMEVPGVRLFSLQKDPPGDDLPLPGAVSDLGGELADFADTAAAIGGLDLVISVDTAVAHLAGALGRPVWLALSAAGDWRWLMARPDSPWYPSMRIFRQTAEGDWRGTMGRIAEALGDLAGQGGGGKG